MSAPALVELRRMMRKKFPQAHSIPFVEEAADKPRPSFTDLSAFPVGDVSEIVPAGAEPVLGLFFAEILGEPEAFPKIPDFVLIDGDGFDPSSYSSAATSRLLWIRCQRAADLIKTADLVLRDGNIPSVILDLGRFPVPDLRALPASHWWRLKQMAGRSGCRLLVLSPFPLVACAATRLVLSTNLTLVDFDRLRSELLPEIRIDPERLRRAT